MAGQSTSERSVSASDVDAARQAGVPATGLLHQQSTTAVPLRRCYGLALRDGARLFLIAPVIPLVAIVPEFVQHVVEIKLGMFESRAAFERLAFDPVRWEFGYVKLAGFWLAVIGAVLMTSPSGTLAGSLWQVHWRRLAIAIAMNAMVVVATLCLPQDGVWMAPQLVLTVATAPLFVYLIGALLGDTSMDLAAAYIRGWGKVLRSALLVIPIFAVCQALHQLHHKWALGQPTALVWLLMSWDALWVGLMTCWIGTAFGLGYGMSKSDDRGHS